MTFIECPDCGTYYIKWFTWGLNFKIKYCYNCEQVMRLAKTEWRKVEVREDNDRC